MKWNTGPAPKQAKVYLGVPTHDGRVQNEVINAVLGAGGAAASITIEGGSALTFNFNNVYCMALNGRRTNGITHFLMLHSDVAVTSGLWVDKMLAIMEREKADVLSVVIRLKTDDGKTSTAIEEPDLDNKRNPLGFKARKLTLPECLERGKTWSDPNLLVNTGCMLVDIRKPWAELVHFEFRDSIHYVEENGIKTFFPVSLAEDYGFSRMVRGHGGKLAVTTEIVATHCGGGRFPNQVPQRELDFMAATKRLLNAAPNTPPLHVA